MDRRNSLKLLAAAGIGGSLPLPPLIAQGSRASSSLDPYAGMQWARGVEGQRKADLGNGTFLRRFTPRGPARRASPISPTGRRSDD